MDPNQDAPLKITINGQEYDESEASDLIDYGRKTKDLETKYNTKFDSVWPEYGKSREEIKRIQTELEDAKAQLTEFQTKKEEGIETPADVKAAQEAARKIGIPLKEDLDKAGYIKQADLDVYFDKRKANEQAVNAVLAEADKLEKDITGTDGRPKFNKRAVMAYASAYGFSDMQAAYEDMNKDQIDAWREATIAREKGKSIKTLGHGGVKEPARARVDDSNFQAILHEALAGGGE